MLMLMLKKTIVMRTNAGTAKELYEWFYKWIRFGRMTSFIKFLKKSVMEDLSSIMELSFGIKKVSSIEKMDQLI